jgi:YHS domain-containing protein
MMRILGELISLVFFFLLIRQAITAVLSLMRGGTPRPQNPGPTFQQQQQSAELHTSGELRKDPVCGTFVPTTTAWTKPVSGATVYFCSKECRDRHKPDSSNRKWRENTAVRS